MSPPSIFFTLLHRHFDIDTDRSLVHQLAAKIARDRNEHSRQAGDIHPPRPNLHLGIIHPQQPVERGERQQHDRQYRMTPGRNQPANASHRNQIKQADKAGYPTAKGTHAGEPQAGSGPEKVTAHQVSEIRGHQTDQRRNRKVNQHGVDGMAAQGHPADDGFVIHTNSSRNNLAVQKLLRCGRYLSLFTVCWLLSGCSGPFSMLDPAGPSARSAAWLWWAMFSFSAIVLFAVVGLWLYAINRRFGSNSKEEDRRLGHRWIIGGGVILPIASTTLLLIFGIPLGHKMLPLPPAEGEVLRIEVTGHQWWWEIRYPDSGITLRNEIHIPANTPVDIHLTTADVIHAFWVPRLGGKLDAIPGRTNILRLQADEPGVYRGQCAEFCGLHHAHMQFTVEAHAPQDFSAWLNEGTP